MTHLFEKPLTVRTPCVLPVAVLVGLSACGSSLNDGSQAEEAQPAQETLASDEQDTLTVVSADEALNSAFRPLYPDRPEGPNLFVLEGDPNDGPSLTVFRYGRNYDGSSSLHSHTHDYRLWLIEGELKHWDESGSADTAPVLSVGSYLHQPADQLHAANCLSERCTAYVLFDGSIETDAPSAAPQD